MPAHAVPRVAAIAGALLLLAASDAAGAEDDFAIALEPGGATVRAGPGFGVTALEESPEAAGFLLDFAGPGRGVVEVGQRFQVERPRQVVLTLDGGVPPEVRWEQFATAEAPATNISAEAGLRFHLAVPAGNHTLRLTLDVAPPRWRLEYEGDVTPHGLLVRTSTDEPALAELRVQRAGRPDVLFPTPQPAFVQTFPVSGLDADTEYAYVVAFRDYSGNVATTPPAAFRMLPQAAVQPPLLELVFPANGSVLREPVREVRARIIDPGAGPVPFVLLFVDKVPSGPVEVPPGGEVVYPLAAPLGVGTHTITVEATNEPGGKAVLRAKFLVEGATPTPGAALAWAVLAFGALARRRAGPGDTD